MADGSYADDFHSDEEKDAAESGKGWQDIRIEDIELDSKPLSGGGFALVYRGLWKGRYVAVKTLVR
jgi:hypothetical protein